MNFKKCKFDLNGSDPNINVFRIFKGGGSKVASQNTRIS